MNTLKSQTFGGQLISAQLLGQDIFYYPNTIAPPPIPTRAGVPILFPQFSDHGPLVKHGMARLQEWHVFSMLDGCVSSSLLLTEQADWPHRAQLNMDANIEDEHLEIHLQIRNVGNSDFTWTGGLHPYFLVGDVTHAQVKGLNLDLSAQDLHHVGYDVRHPITDCVEIHAPKLNIRLEQTGFDSWMVWNPGAQHTLKDIPQQDWQKFLCVEPVCLNTQTLKAGGEWFGSMSIHLL